MHIAYGDWESYVGKKVRVTRGGTSFVAKVLGLNKNGVRMTGPTTSVAPWIVQLDNGSTRDVVPGQEVVEEFLEKGFFMDRQADRN